MIIFGLFFGLLFLPVLLSICGADPNPKGNIDEDYTNNNPESDIPDVKDNLMEKCDLNSPS